MAVFRFKRFDVDDMGCGMRICSDSVLFGAWYFKEHSDSSRIVDVGCGSGILSLIAAELCPHSVVEGIEIDHGAFKASVSNFENSPWRERLRAIEGSFEQFQAVEHAPDCIASNPPFFLNGELSCDSERALARHQGELNYKSLMDFARRILSKDGCLGFISPYDQAEDIIFYSEIKGLKLRRRCDVHTSMKRPCKRILWDFSMKDGEYAYEKLYMRDKNGEYTDDYRSLVENLYLKL